MTDSRLVQDQYVVFRTGEEQYGLPVRYVKEIQRPVAITGLPHAPAFIQGLANLRGLIIPVVSSRQLLGFAGREPGPDQRILLLKGNTRQLGLLVDGLSGVSTVDSGQTYPYASAGATGWVTGLAYTANGWFIRLLDADKLFGFMRLEGTIRPKAECGGSRGLASFAPGGKEPRQRTGQYIRFQAGGNSFAVPVHQVLDIQPMPKRIEPLAGGPEAMIGFAVVRGIVIPVFDAGMVTDNSRGGKMNRVIVLELAAAGGSVLIGLAVEQATEMLRISPEEIAEAPAVLGKGQGQWVTGLYRDDKTLSIVYILDVSKADFVKEVSTQGRAAAPVLPAWEEESKKRDGQFLLFQVNQDLCAIPVESVREILRATALTPVPHAGELVAGLANIRGQLVTVVNLSRRLSRDSKNGSPGECLVVLQAGQQVRAFAADRILGLRRTRLRSIEELQGLRTWLPEQEKLLGGMVELADGQMAVVLNPQQVCRLD